MEKNQVEIVRHNIGRALKSIREDRKISTYQASKKGIRFELLTAVENGDKSYTIDTLIQVLDLLGMTEEFLDFVSSSRHLSDEDLV